MVISARFRRLFWVAIVSISAASSALAESHGKEILIALNWGDQVAEVATTGQEPLLTPESLRKLFRRYKEAGVDTVLFRADVFRFPRDCDWPEPKTLPGYKNAPSWVYDAAEREWLGAHRAVQINLLKSVVDVAHEQGLKIFTWSTTFADGMPLREINYPKGEMAGRDPKTGKPWYYEVDQTSDMACKIFADHPEYVMVDRSQKKHNWGTIEFAYPEARAYAVGYNRWFLEKYPFDGLYVDFRNEYAHPEFADQFGFAPPIVAEYERRYGVNILREEFDLEKWRRLCGEYLTQFISELGSMARSHRKPLLVGIAQGNYIGLPNGNMYVDWQGWAKAHLVDGLVIGAYTGTRLFPEHIGYGYLTDMEFGIGLPNLLWDLQNNYWPECAKYHVRLYDDPTRGPHPLPLAEVARTNVDGLYVSDDSFPVLKKWEEGSEQ